MSSADRETLSNRANWAAAQRALHAAWQSHGQKSLAATASLLCNGVFLLLLFRQDLQPGDAQVLVPESLTVLIAAPNDQPSKDFQPDRTAAVEPSPQMPPFDMGSLPRAPAPQLLPTDEPAAPLPSEPNPQLAELPDASPSVAAAPTAVASDAPTQPRQAAIAPAQQAMLVKRIVAAAQALDGAPQSEVSWSEDGQTYRATLAREAAKGSMDLDNIAVDVTATGADGAQLQTRLTVQRLAFSQFTQVVDYWDSSVQLHDDQIVGRFHSNSPFYVGDDSEAAPSFSGKVSTAARALRFATAGSRRRAKMFQGGLETRAGRIELPDQSRPFGVAPEQDSYLHTFSDDAHITLNRDGSYTWQGRRSDIAEVGRYPQDRPTYFIASRGATLYVRGTVHGKVHIYSPERIVIEGNLVYADDPRSTPGASDYLGLVSDRVVEIAPPYVTGRGDLTIQAAIFARRRFVVANIDHRRTATLIIYGSLTVGSISATEPRYATRIEFDPRFERTRPPGFPTTNRYEVASWEAAWSEIAP